MYRLIIVDDNPLDRNGLKSCIDWDSMDIEVVGTYSNGKQVVEDIQNVNPDIILSDISMPVMSGIEMVKRLKEKGFDIKTIFMSCHDEFNFAKSAVSLDVEFYVLKPIVPEELQEAINKVLNKHMAEKVKINEKAEMLKLIDQSLPLYVDQFIRELLYGNLRNVDDINKRAEFLKINWVPGSEIQVVSMIISNSENKESVNDIRDSYIEMYLVKNLIEDYSKDGIEIHIVQIAMNEYAIVAIKTQSATFASGTFIVDVMVGVKNLLMDEYGFKASIGISKPSDDGFGAISDLYKQSQIALKSRFYSDNDRIVEYEEIEDNNSCVFEQLVDLQVLYRELKELLLEGNGDSVNELIDKYIVDKASGYEEGYVKSFTFSVVNILQILLVENNESFSNIFGNEIIIWNKLSQFETIRDVKRWIYNIINSVIGYLYNDSKGQYTKIVEDIKDIIKNKYQEPLTVNEIAKTIFLSLSHANNVFKKVEGKTIFDYLQEYRVEAAMKLLREQGSRVYAVAEQVGYSNKSHFCMVFKKVTGASPMEYKNRFTRV